MPSSDADRIAAGEVWRSARIEVSMSCMASTEVTEGHANVRPAAGLGSVLDQKNSYQLTTAVTSCWWFKISGQGVQMNGHVDRFVNTGAGSSRLGALQYIPRF